MQAILEQIAAAPELNNIEPLVALVDTLRPAKHTPIDSAAARLEALIALLQAQPPYAAALRHYLLRILSTKRQASLYTDVGILSDGGFFTELFRRLSYRV